MATQGQRRREALAAIRKQRALYRTADSEGERAERELDRLLRRKTLVSLDELAKLGNLINLWSDKVIIVQRAFATLAEIIRNIPR